jgi:hypothetical protein
MAVPVPAAPTLPLDEIYESLCRDSLGVHNARHLRQEKKCAQLRSRLQEIFDIHLWARDTLGIQGTHQSLQRAFNCAQSTVRAALQNGSAELKQ